MRIVKRKIFLLLFIFCAWCIPVFAQGCFDENTENELLGYFREVKRLQNRAGEEMPDSLDMANTRFCNFLTYAVQNNYSIVDDLNKLLYEGMDYSISDDHALGIFSWEVRSFMGMHYRNAVLFYKTMDGIKSIKYLDGYAPDRVVAVHPKNKKTIYLIFWEDNYSLKGRYKKIAASLIEARYGPESPVPAPVFYNGKNDSISYIEYKYDIASYSNLMEAPEILLAAKGKKIFFPIVKNDGNFDGKYMIYNFDGYKYVLDNTPNKKEKH